MKRFYLFLTATFFAANVFGQGFIDLTDNSSITPWLPAGALRQTYANIGTPAITVTAAVEGSTGRFINTTP
jgi:hypothetical protein